MNEDPKALVAVGNKWYVGRVRPDDGGGILVNEAFEVMVLESHRRDQEGRILTERQVNVRTVLFFTQGVRLTLPPSAVIYFADLDPFDVAKLEELIAGAVAQGMHDRARRSGLILADGAAAQRLKG